MHNSKRRCLVTVHVCVFVNVSSCDTAIKFRVPVTVHVCVFVNVSSCDTVIKFRVPVTVHVCVFVNVSSCDTVIKFHVPVSAAAERLARSWSSHISWYKTGRCTWRGDALCQLSMFHPGQKIYNVIQL